MRHGEAVIKTDDQIIIPAGKVHSLSIKSDFVATPVMAKVSEIQYEKATL